MCVFVEPQADRVLRRHVHVLLVATWMPLNVMNFTSAINLGLLIVDLHQS
jgi:hypothetical protein